MVFSTHFTTSRWSCCCRSRSDNSLGINVTATLCNPKSSIQIACAELVLIPTLSAISRAVMWQSFVIEARVFSATYCNLLTTSWNNCHSLSMCSHLLNVCAALLFRWLWGHHPWKPSEFCKLFPFKCLRAFGKISKHFVIFGKLELRRVSHAPPYAIGCLAVTDAHGISAKSYACTQRCSSTLHSFPSLPSVLSTKKNPVSLL